MVCAQHMTAALEEALANYLSGLLTLEEALELLGELDCSPEDVASVELI